MISPYAYFNVKAQEALSLVETISYLLTGQKWGQRWRLHIAVIYRSDEYLYERNAIIL